MRRTGEFRWQVLIGILLLVAVMAACSSVQAQGSLKREVRLNGIGYNSSFIEVLKVKGPPHYVGPALASADALRDVLDPPPLPPATEMAQPSMGGEMQPGMGMPQKKKQEELLIWMYEGDGAQPDPNSAWVTYVLFRVRGPEMGKVAGVVVALRKKPQAMPAAIRTSNDVRFGTSMFEVVKKFGWPEPLARIGNYYFGWYNDQNVAFTMDVASRKVIAIAIGLPLTVLFNVDGQGQGQGTPGSETPSGPTLMAPPVGGLLPGPPAMPGR